MRTALRPNGVRDDRELATLAGRSPDRPVRGFDTPDVSSRAFSDREAVVGGHRSVGGSLFACAGSRFERPRARRRRL